MDSLAQFDYLIEDTMADYQMLIYVRHTEQYPYQNMWLFVDDAGRQDTIEFYLADDRRGSFSRILVRRNWLCFRMRLQPRAFLSI